MPLDALCLTAVASELRRKLTGGKIDKIYQPSKDQVLLYIRANAENVRYWALWMIAPTFRTKSSMVILF